jgi:hypothetical protein
MRLFGIALTFSLSLLAAQVLAADPCGVPACGATGCGSANRCDNCGCECACQQRTCQLICGTEKVKKYCWVVKCEEYCPLLPGNPFGHCDCDNGGTCQQCENAGKCGEKCPSLRINEPRTMNARVAKTLEKKEYECERPKYKTVVRYLCPQCAAGCTTVPVAPVENAKPNAPAPMPAPEAPKPKTTLVMPLPSVIGTAYVQK